MLSLTEVFEFLMEIKAVHGGLADICLGNRKMDFGWGVSGLSWTLAFQFRLVVLSPRQGHAAATQGIAPTIFVI